MYNDKLIETMKEKTLSLLGTAEVEAGLLLAALDFVAKKVAVQAKSIKKRVKKILKRKTQ